MKRLWIDDERYPPKNWTGDPAPDWAQTAVHAINLLRAAHESGEPYDEVSFDHDLGYDIDYLKVHGEFPTTRAVMRWMDENGVWPKVLYVHSASPVGASWLMTYAEHDGPEDMQVIRSVYRG